MNPLAEPPGQVGGQGFIGDGKFHKFGVSSLARVGGGGGIDNSARVMAQLARRQLAVQEEMRDELKKLNDNPPGALK